MSVDYSSALFCGVKLDEITLTNTVTKYNEDTGKPYKKHQDDVVWVIDRTQIEIIPKNSEIDYWEQENIELHGLEIIDTYFRGDYFLGLMIAEAYSEIDLDDASAVKISVDKILKEKFKYFDGCKVYLIQRVSY